MSQLLAIAWVAIHLPVYYSSGHSDRSWNPDSVCSYLLHTPVYGQPVALTGPLSHNWLWVQRLRFVCSPNALQNCLVP